MDTVTLTIDGRPSRSKGQDGPPGGHRSGHQGSLLLLPPGPRHRRVLPRLHRQDREDAEAADVVLDDGRRRHGRPTQTPDVVERARRRVRVPADQSPARLPGLRQGRRVSAAGLLLHVRARTRAGWTFPRRVFDGEGVKADVDFGPTLMLNRNRCILCTRCVRFMREIDGDAQIGIVDRGYGSEIATFQEQGVHSLLSGNLMDVCPVGAITTRDYRFKSRPWDNPERRRHDLHALREGLQHDGVAQGEARMGEGRAAGAHDAALQPRGQRLLDVRHRPLRLSLDRRRRAPAQPLVRTRPARSSRPTGNDVAKVADLRDVAGGGLRRCVLVSAHASLEELFRADRQRSAARSASGRRRVGHLARREKPQPPHVKFNGSGGGCAERERRAAISGFPSAPATTGRHRRPARRRRGGPSRRCTCSIRSGWARSATSWIVERARRASCRLLIVQGVLLTPLAKAPTSCCRRRWVEKDAILHQRRRGGCRRRRAPSRPGRSARGLADLRQRRLALGLRWPTRAARRPRRSAAGMTCATRRYAGHRPARVRAAD